MQKNPIHPSIPCLNQSFYFIKMFLIWGQVKNYAIFIIPGIPDHVG